MGWGWEGWAGKLKINMNNIGLERVQNDNNLDFKHIIKDDDNENDNSPYDNIGHFCNYFEQDEFSTKVSNISKQVTTFSQNIRSLPGKFSDFSEQMSFLNNGNFKFTVISITEVWNVPKNVNFDLPGYRPFDFKIRDNSGLNSNSGGGVGLWVDQDFEYDNLENLSVFEPHVFESQFIKLKTTKNKFTIIGNIYRLNTAFTLTLTGIMRLLITFLQR